MQEKFLRRIKIGGAIRRIPGIEHQSQVAEKEVVTSWLVSRSSRIREVFAKNSGFSGRGAQRLRFLKRNLLIPSVRIFDSNVDAGIPNAAAAPKGPDTLPPVFVNAASIVSFS